MRSTLGALLVFLLLPAPVAAQSLERTVKALYWANGVLQLGDVGSTADAVLTRGAVEANPVLRPCDRDMTALALCKGVWGVGALWAINRYVGPQEGDPPAVRRAKRKREALALAVFAGVTAAVIVRNARVNR